MNLSFFLVEELYINCIMKTKLLILSIIICHYSFGQHKRWVEPSQLDTVINISKEVSIKLTPHKEVDYEEYFLSNHEIDSLTSPYGNFYQKSLAIEKNMVREYPDLIKREGNELSVKLKNGEWLSLENNVEFDEVGHSFEFYFKEFGFHSIRVQWGEGNGYKLVNTTSGEIINLIGRPYFSPNGKYLISLGNDIEAGYSINGFQLLRHEKGKITEIGRFQPSSWGCNSALWLSNDSLVLKNESIEFSETGMNYFHFFTKMEIQ